jgi:hypothetical protein
MVGSGANYTIGSWLLKGEAAYVDGLEYFQVRGQKARFDVMGGVEYYGLANTTISFELLNRHIFDYEDAIEEFASVKENSVEIALRVKRDFMNQRLSATLLATIRGITAADGSFVRLSADYDLLDALNLEGGVIFYQKGDNLLFQRIEDNDRLFLNLKYSF